ncbi:MAG: hypothetical protein B6242_07210 [Anaerolineaceae bacterium 4572_78]|nr:MAG: hypothetical protein B6242_07210 [Anaerolineaceae bacterium 4572_78]
MNHLDPNFVHLPIPEPKILSDNHFKKLLRLNLFRLIGKINTIRKCDFRTPQNPRIVLMRPDHIGDILFLTPALLHLRKLYPHADITLMVGSWGKDIVQNNPHIDHTLTCDFPGFTRRPKKSLCNPTLCPSPLKGRGWGGVSCPSWQPYRYLIEQAKIIKQFHFDIAIILRFDHWWGAWLAMLADIPYRIGYAIPTVIPFLTTTMPYIDQRHEVEQNWQLIDHVQTIIPHVRQIESDIPGDMEFFISKDDTVWATTWLNNHKIINRSCIIIHPGAGAKVKLWRNTAWIQLAQTLIDKYNAYIILSGSLAERKLCKIIATKLKSHYFVTAGETTIGQLAALMKHATLVIGPDTGPLKLAIAVGTPTIQLYGPVDAVKFGAWGNKNKHRLITSGLSCIPCNRLDYTQNEVESHFCVRGISVESVLSECATFF